MFSIALVLALAPQGGGDCRVVINEFLYDHRSTDADEFIELYNAGSSAVDIGDWVIDGEDDGFPTSTNNDFVIPTGTILAAGDYFLIANPNATNAALTSPDYAPTIASGELLENSGFNNSGTIDSIILRNAVGDVVDAVSYEAFRLQSPFVTPAYTPDPSQIEGPGIIGDNWNPRHPAVLHSWSRKRDGYDTDDNGRDFHLRIMTPGASNDPVFNVNQSLYFSDAETIGLVHGDALPKWSGTFTDPEVFDYASAGIVTPSPVDGTTTGATILRFGDAAAGSGIGNNTWLETVSSAAVVVECYVYFETALTNAGSGEYWHLGFGGTAGTYFNLPSPVWTGSFNDSADVTGAGLTFVVDDTAATLSLVDYANGSGATVLASMSAPSGWQRVRLEASESTIEVRIGGTPFQMDGTVMSGALAGGATYGGVMVGHRRQGDIGRAASPFYADSMFINGYCESFGHPTQNASGGTPRIALSGVPYTGNANLELHASGLIPNAAYFQLVGFNPGGGIDVSLALPGAVPPCLTLWVANNFIGSTINADQNGEGVRALFTPAPGQFGIKLWAQVMQVDFGLPFPIPLSASDALEIEIGSF
ncbi:MAG: lamin tail domain-containing protein [Planctomycetes bacterium]|nr:lamin tail domain-containing protein [Planctomycetota bacterium]